MKIRGTWYVVPADMALGYGMDRSKMLPIEFGDGVITLVDGSQPAYEHLTAEESPKGYATLTFDYMPTETGRYTRILIDRASELSVGGMLYSSDKPLPAGELDDVPGVRAEPLEIASTAYLDKIERDIAAFDAGEEDVTDDALPAPERETLH